MQYIYIFFLRRLSRIAIFLGELFLLRKVGCPVNIADLISRSISAKTVSAFYLTRLFQSLISQFSCEYCLIKLQYQNIHIATKYTYKKITLKSNI